MTESTPKQTDRPLRIVRQAQGLSLRKAADRAGLDPGHLSRVERGQGGLSLDSLARLASVLGLRDLERLLSPYRANSPLRGRRTARHHDDPDDLLVVERQADGEVALVRDFAGFTPASDLMRPGNDFVFDLLELGLGLFDGGSTSPGHTIWSHLLIRASHTLRRWGERS